MADKNLDRTWVAVSRQLKVMDCDQYELGIFDRRNNKMVVQVSSAEMILKRLGFLKRMNAEDNDIFIRPFGATGLIFFDDFNVGMLSQLVMDGLAPALVIQSSPFNFHGWLRLSETPLDEELCTYACKVVSRKYGGDEGAAKWRQFGRLAGFTNRKPKYINDAGMRPFVLLSEHKGAMALNAAHLLSEAAKLMCEFEEERQARIELYKSVAVDEGLQDSEQFFLSELREMWRRFGSQLDYSRGDWVIVNKMLARGFHRKSIESALLEHSLHIKDKGSRSAIRYVEITLNKALGIK